jgi:hypothetical protein
MKRRARRRSHASAKLADLTGIGLITLTAEDRNRLPDIFAA